MDKERYVMVAAVIHAGTCCPRCGGSCFPERVLDSDKREPVCISCGYIEVPVDLTALGELAQELEGTLYQAHLNRKPYRGGLPL